MLASARRPRGRDEQAETYSWVAPSPLRNRNRGGLSSVSNASAACGSRRGEGKLSVSLTLNPRRANEVEHAHLHRVVVRDLDVPVRVDVAGRDAERPDDGTGVLDACARQQLGRVRAEVAVLEDGELGGVVVGQRRRDVGRQLGRAREDRDVADGRVRQQLPQDLTACGSAGACG